MIGLDAIADFVSVKGYEAAMLNLGFKKMDKGAT